MAATVTPMPYALPRGSQAAGRPTASAAPTRCVMDAAGGVLAYEDLKDVTLCGSATTAPTRAAYTLHCKQPQPPPMSQKGKKSNMDDKDGDDNGAANEVQQQQQQQQEAQTAQQQQLVVIDSRRMHNVLMPFSGFYEDVTYPIATLYAPPQPPSTLPPRQRMPLSRRQRLAAAAQRDLSLAGPRDHHAQCVVSKVWRGVLSRRQVRNDRTYQHILNARARMIQCWWRSLGARREHARRALLKREWLLTRTHDYEADRLAGMLNMMKWQQRRYETAARLLQRVVRWFLRKCACASYAREGLAADAWPQQPLPFPLPRHTTTYFPWRQRPRRPPPTASTTPSPTTTALTTTTTTTTATREGTAGGHRVGQANGKAPQRRRTLLEFRRARAQGGSAVSIVSGADDDHLDGDGGDGGDDGDGAAAPLPLEAVERANARMRRRTRDRMASLCDPAAVSRQSWKRDHLRREDLDFNAGVIQRAYRARRATTQLATREVSKTYMDKVVRTLVRAFRMHALLQHMQARRHRTERTVRAMQQRYSHDRIAHVDHELVWGRELMDRCAATIQRCWRWHYYMGAGGATTPAAAALAPPPLQPRDTEAAEGADGDETEAKEAEEAAVAADGLAAPLAPPPYGLLTAHLTRQRELRLARMTLQERNAAAMQQRRTCTRFRPAQPIMRRRLGRYIAAESEEGGR